ncbi:MAG: PilZ domain-containing protein [Proteobacteria bacterium]|nr:PilZ domain-containing protein [Pseudomonadota bacterium]
MKEKRKHKRVNLIYYLEIYDNRTDKHLGHLVDITPEGLMMISEKEMEAGAEFHLRMLLPETAYGKKAISFKANSCWVKKDMNPAFFASGYQIVDIGPVESKTITSLIDNYAFSG